MFGSRRSGTQLERLIAAANDVHRAQLPFQWGGGHEQPARFGRFDCSGAVSYVVQQAGYDVATAKSGDFGSWRFPLGEGPVTIFFNEVHTFIRIGNCYWGTSGVTRPNRGAGWLTYPPSEGYLRQFHAVHLPGIDRVGRVRRAGALRRFVQRTSNACRRAATRHLPSKLVRRTATRSGFAPPLDD